MAPAGGSHDALFAALISGYTTQALVALGKMTSPISGEIERNLDQARVMIDMLEMLETKTEGNRSEEETSALRQSISTLRLNYVEEVNKPAPQGSLGASGDSDPDTETDPPEDADAPEREV